MPRAIVGPGRRSNLSCSRASSWRGANLSSAATSAIAMPFASRARASSAPTERESVKVTLLQGLIFSRRREGAAQLVGEALLGDALAQLALDAQGEPQRLGAGQHQLVEARHQPPRLVELALAIADLAELQQRSGFVGLHLER